MEEICAAYDIGKLQHFAPIEVGYEDCNVKITTDKGNFLAKIFAKFRTVEEITRIVEIMQKIIAAGIHHPKIYKTIKGDFAYKKDNISMVLMEFINGKTFYEMNRIPDEAEFREITEQAAKINAIAYKPSYLFDGWAVQNAPNLFEVVKDFMKPNDRTRVAKIIEDFKQIPMDKLPHAFVHGDFIPTNLIKGPDQIYILDFSVANWYPRLQEVALLVTHLTDKTKGSLAHRTQYVADVYSQFLPLEEIERKYLAPYVRADTISELLGALNEKHLKGNTSIENEHWIEFGLKGLYDD